MLLQFSFPDFERLPWALPIAVTLHNLEEAIWLPSAAKHLDMLPRQMSPGPFRVGVGVLTVAAYLITWFSVADGIESVWTYIFVAYTFAMFLNVFVPHVPAAILLRGYAPSVVTAVLVNLPVTTVLLAEIWKYRIVHSLGVAILVFGVPLGSCRCGGVYVHGPIADFGSCNVQRPLDGWRKSTEPQSAGGINKRGISAFQIETIVSENFHQPSGTNGGAAFARIATARGQMASPGAIPGN